MHGGEETVGQRSARTLSALLVGKVGGLIITTLTTLLIANLLGPSAYGLYTIALGYAVLLGASSHFGVASYINKEVAAKSYKKDARGVIEVLANGYIVIVPIAAFLALLGVAVSGYAATNWFANSGIQAITLSLAAINLFFYMVWGTSYTTLLSFGEGGAASKSLLLLNTVQLIMSYLFIHFGYGVNGAIAGILAGDALGFILTSYMIYGIIGKYKGVQYDRPNKSSIKKTLAFTIPVALNNTFNNGVNGFAVLLLSTYVATFIVGNFGAANQGLTIMVLIYGTVQSALLQLFSTVLEMGKKKEDIERIYNKTLIYSLLITLPAILFLGVFAKPLMAIVLSKYTLAPGYLFLISLGVTVGVIAIYTSSFIISSGKVLEALRYSFLSLVVQVIALLLLVPTYSALGAIASLFYIGSFVSAFLLFGGLKKLFGISPAKNKLTALFMSNALVFLIASAALLISVDILSLAVGAILTCVLYPPALVLFGIINRETRDDILRLTAKIPIVDRLVAYLFAYSNVFIDRLQREKS